VTAVGTDPSVRRSVSRRAVLQGTGALIVTFTIFPVASSQETSGAKTSGGAPKLPGSLTNAPFLDAWIRIDADGSATAFTGKAELGQGIKTALLQVTAEELEMPLNRLTLITADTALTANEGYTAGSHSTQDSGTALRNAAAQTREILIGEAARRMNLPADQLKAANGTVIAPNGARLSYAELVSPTLLHVQAQPNSKLKDPDSFRIMNRSQPRIDIPGKVTGGSVYVQDMRLPGMLHARLVRPPSYGAQLAAVDTRAVEHMPGVVRIVRDGNFLAVVAEREYQAIKAMRALAAATQWRERPALPKQADLAATLLSLPVEDFTILEKPASTSNAAATAVGATYTRPYLAHASIGPSCAIAQLQDGMLTVWTHTQGVYPDRQAIAAMLGLAPEKVHCIHVEGSGCYGHNGADDAAGDAALIASQVPGHPIRVQWMREQEFAWEPFGPAMITKAHASLDSSGRIADWDYGVWSNTHSTRPGPAGSLLAGQHMARAFAPPPPKPLPQPEGGGDRNAIPLYALPHAKVVHHFIPSMPIRVSALRSLGAHMNVFSIESFMDELALAALSDPVAFRLEHLDDPRARAVVTNAADRFGWAGRQKGGNGRGCGFGFARYKNLAAYCAIALELEVERETGRVRVQRIVAAVDTGQVVNPDGIRNQIEGGILQSMSWTLYESVSFDETRILCADWSTYPILRFDSVPNRVDVYLVDRPGQPFLGCGEASQGPASAALANAIADATGKRLRELPLTAARIKAAVGI
jgi:nicotinate dehydrogenase subunit B